MSQDRVVAAGEDDTEDVGFRLRLTRERFGYSQRRLSKLSGVSNAAISMIEKGSLNPTVGTMVRLLRAFPISMSDFWQAEPVSAEKVFFHRDELKKISNNRITYRQVTSDRDPSIIFQYERYEPGADTGFFPDGRGLRDDRHCAVRRHHGGFRRQEPGIARRRCLQVRRQDTPPFPCARNRTGHHGLLHVSGGVLMKQLGSLDPSEADIFHFEIIIDAIA